MVLSRTKRTPSYWLQLARIRKAARSLTANTYLADVAENFGFSDQSHMNREFQRWLGAYATSGIKFSNYHQAAK